MTQPTTPARDVERKTPTLDALLFDSRHVYEPTHLAAARAELAALVERERVLVDALREADPHGDADNTAIRALANAALNQPSLMGGQKEAIASLLQQYARFLRVAAAALRTTGAQS